MKTIIAGGRDYRLTEADVAVLNRLKYHLIDSVLTGGARGVDTDGDRWAFFNGLPRRVVDAQWKLLGPSAGPIRNAVMAEAAQACVLFPGGPGTEDMRQKAIDARLLIVRVDTKAGHKGAQCGRAADFDIYHRVLGILGLEPL